MERRTTHPYFMYEGIRAQPAVWRSVVAEGEGQVARIAVRIAESPRVFLVGLGTSLYAAMAGKLILDRYGGQQEYWVVDSFDFVHYGPRLAPSDCVIVTSQRGARDYSALALCRAQEAGCTRVLFAGGGADREAGRALADHALFLVPQEISYAHTLSYTGSVALFTLLARSLGKLASNAERLTDELMKDTLPQAIETCLELETQVKRAAAVFDQARRIFVIGGGPGAVVAHEIGLKLKETSYRQAEGISSEPFLHGHFQCSEAEDCFILVAPLGKSRARTMVVADMAADIGARFMVVSDCEPSDARAVEWVTVPNVPEPFSALCCMVPLQLLAYHLALIRGTNPDGFRLEDPRFAKAMARVRLEPTLSIPGSS